MGDNVPTDDDVRIAQAAGPQMQSDRFKYDQAAREDVIDERTGRLVAGHGRVQALDLMEREGEDRPEGIGQEDHAGAWLIPTVRGWRSRSDEEAQAVLLADNRLTERGGWLERQLAETVRDLAAGSDDLLRAAGFDDRDTRRLLATLNVVPPSAPDAFPELNPAASFAHTCPRCHFQWDD